MKKLFLILAFMPLIGFGQLRQIDNYTNDTILQTWSILFNDAIFYYTGDSDTIIYGLDPFRSWWLKTNRFISALPTINNDTIISSDYANPDSFEDIRLKFNNSVDSANNYGILASNYGFLPTSTASENVAAWNSMPSGFNIVVDVDGTYEIDSTLLLKSNTTYTFTGAIDTIKKTGTGAAYTHVFANENIGAKTRDNNINFYGGGLFIDVNGIDNYNAASALYRMKGQFSFYRVDTFVIDGVESINTQTNQFLFHFSDISNFVISNISSITPKDVIHFNGLVFDGIVEDIYTDAFDDAIGFMATDWAIGTPSAGSLERVTFRRWTDVSQVQADFGSAMRINSSSWATWNTDSTYRKGAVTVSSGQTYIKTNDGAQTPTVAPTHTEGYVTGADGIEWAWMDELTNTEGFIRDITFEDCEFQSPLRSFDWFADDDNVASGLQVVYPGTEGNSWSENIVFDNCNFNPDTDITNQVINVSNYIKGLTFRNCSLNTDKNITLLWPKKVGSAVKSYRNVLTNITYDNFYADLTKTSNLLTIFDDNVQIDTVELLNSELLLDSNYVFNLYQKSMTDDSTYIHIVNSTVDSMRSITEEPHGYNHTIFADNSTFTNPIKVVYSDGFNGGGIKYKSRDCGYTNPQSDYLFSVDAASSLLTIDIDTSVRIGDFSQYTIADIATSKTECDLYDVPIEVFDGNTLAWFDLLNKSKIDTTGTAVNQWNDAMELGHNLITDNGSPAIGGAGILFDGVDDRMRTTSFVYIQPAMMYLVVKQNSWTSLDRLWDGFGGASSSVTQYSVTPNLDIYAGASLSITNNALNQYQIIRMLVNGTSSSFQIDANTATTGNLGALNPSGFTLGAYGGGTPASFGNIEVKEIILRNVTDDSILQDEFYDYLNTKYSLGL